MLFNRKTLMAAAFLTLAPTLAFAATPSTSGAAPAKPAAAQTHMMKTHVTKTSAVKKHKPMASKMKHQAKFTKKTAPKKPDAKKS